jgi:ferredoxin
MKFIVNKNACIGCGACASICPQVFEINDEGLAYAKVSEDVRDDSEMRDAIMALENCPTGAIQESKKETTNYN